MRSPRSTRHGVNYILKRGEGIGEETIKFANNAKKERKQTS